MSSASEFSFVRKYYEKYSRALGKDGGCLLLGKIIQMGNGFLVSVYLVKTFGLGAVGTYTIASIATSAIAFICSFGLSNSMPRDNFSNAQRNTISLAILTLAVPLAALLIGGYAWMMGHDFQEITEIAVFSAAGDLFAQSNIVNTLLLLQGRTRLSVVPPLLNCAGILLGMVSAETLFQFGMMFIASRLLGNVLLFINMQYEPVGWSVILQQAKKGAKFLPMDLMSQFSEQLVSFMLAILLPRTELGIFGLCRQVVYAAITPGWSHVDASYPQFVSSRLENADSVKKQNRALSNLATVLVICGSFVLGIFVYKIPQFWFMCILLAFSIPSRYLGYFYDKILRSAGQVKTCNYVTFARICLSMAIFPIFVLSFQLWGAILGWVLLSLLSLILWQRAARPVLEKETIAAVI